MLALRRGRRSLPQLIWSLHFTELKNGTTMYADDVANNQWSVSVRPSLRSGVQLLLEKRDGMHLRYQDALPYVDTEVGIHCVEAVAVYHGQVVRRQLFYTVLSRERGLPEWGLPPYVPLSTVVPTDATLWLQSKSMYLQVLLPKCIFVDQISFPFLRIYATKQLWSWFRCQ